ncbi:MAG: ATP-binding cassette domain-containing protein, partial [Halothiobacillaceae bacterium]
MAETSFLIRAVGVTVERDGTRLLDGVDLAVAPRQIVTLVGPNGAGKTTLVRVLLGLMKAESGQVERREGLVVGYVPQRFQPPPSLPMDVDAFLRLAGVSSVGRRNEVLDG